MRRVCGNDELYHISSFVDVNNLISVESGLSVCSYYLENIHGDIVFRKAGNDEGHNRNIYENMIVLADDDSILGSLMSDSTRAMVTEKTKYILGVTYCFE